MPPFATELTDVWGIIKAAGLKVATVDMETLALQHLIEHSEEAMGVPQELPYALVDVGQISLNFSVFKGALGVGTGNSISSR